MSGLAGLDRTPKEDVRPRRNAGNLATDVSFIDDSEVIGITPGGVLTLKLRDDGGLENDAGELAILLDTDPGLVLSTDGLTVLVSGVVDLDATGVHVNIGSGLENDGSDNLQVALADDSMLEFDTGDLQVDRDEMHNQMIHWGF